MLADRRALGRRTPFRPPQRSAERHGIRGLCGRPRVVERRVEPRSVSEGLGFSRPARHMAQQSDRPQPRCKSPPFTPEFSQLDEPHILELRKLELDLVKCYLRSLTHEASPTAGSGDRISLWSPHEYYCRSKNDNIS